MTTTAPARTVPLAPGALPLLGHWHRFGKRPYRFLSTLTALGPVVQIRIPGYETYLVTEPELVREALTGIADQGAMIERAELLLGQGVTAVSGATHRRSRRLIAPAFAKARIASYAELMTRFGAERAASWHDGQQLAINDEMHDLALRTVAGTLFSGELGDRTAERIHHLLPEVMTLLARRVTRPAWMDRLPTPRNRRFLRLVAAMKAATGDIIETYRAELAADPTIDHGDLLDTLVRARDDDGNPLPDAHVHDELVNFLVGGTEAIGMTSTWALYELARNPAVEAALHAEIDEVLGDRAATIEDLPRLELTKRIVLETLRVYSPWLTVRRVPADYQLGGYELPADAMLFVCPVAVHRDPEVHADPDRFDPDRWLPEAMATMSRGAHIPFGMGARQCPGNVFALTQVALQLATLCGQWRLRTEPGFTARETVIGALVHPRTMPMRAEKRRAGA